MTTYPELELGVHRSDSATYQVELRFTDPEDEAERPSERGTVAFDPAELLPLWNDPEAYGKALARGLFPDDNTNVLELYGEARAAVEASGRSLRLRLLVGPTAAELQALRWELLRDPKDGSPLATSERTLFSRFLTSYDWRGVRLRPQADLRALVAVAGPSNVADFGLAEVDVDGEVRRARASLRGIAVDVAGQDEPLTLERLDDGLRGGVDVLYLVCHGVLRKRGPYLVLQDEDGRTAWTEGRRLSERVAGLARPPRLVVLASCEGAGTEQGTDAAGRATAESSLAPRLAEAGVPAILAMQGKIAMKTVEKAMPVFFEELLKDGQIDRALAVARRVVRDRDDHWMPALYLRLKRGRIWYVPGFTGGQDEFKKWDSICRQARSGKLIPILGPDVSERLCGTSRELAERLAAKYRFPMAPHERGDLAKVTQYLVVDQDREHAEAELLRHFGDQVLERHGHLIRDGEEIALPRLLDRILEQGLEEDDPLSILAGLDSAVYVSASAETLLYKALQRRGDRAPKLRFADWRSANPVPPTFPGKPSRDEPLVYHVFGLYGEWSSMVLTEDEFFDYLIASSKLDLVPEVVSGSLTEGSLLFLGFHLNDWRFRVLFRQIMALGGSHSSEQRNRTHVGVQVDPEEHSLLDVERACRYLERYFQKDRGGSEPQIDVYWGSPADFLGELRRRLDETPPAEKLVTTTAEGWY